MASPHHVCVIGAGIVGSATAYLLAKAGHRVTVIEAHDAPGRVTSFANGAQLSYSHVEPLASPATLRKLPSMLLDADSPLRMRLTGEPAQISWGLQFLRASSAAQVRRTTEALLTLSALSRHELTAARSADGLEFNHAQPGKLVVYDSDEDLAGARSQVAVQRKFGSVQEVLSTEDCLAREPALAAYRAHVKGGVWTPDEALGDAWLLTGALVDRLQRAGGDVRYRTRATGFQRQGDTITAVHTDTGELPVDAVVLANGNGAAALGRQLGMRLPVYPIKGYSITLPVVDPACAPRVSVTDLRRKTVYAPLGGQLRVAGMAELVGHDLRVDPRRVRFLIDSARETFPGSCDFGADPQAWVGLRPATPTSMPLIGPSRCRNGWLNVGHGALGFTLAMGSARLVQQWVAGEPPGPAAQAFIHRG